MTVVSHALTAALERNPAALGQALSVVEQGGPGARDIAAMAFSLSGRANTLGITGAPGAGKSTLMNRLTVELRDRQQRVALLAIDPSSPNSGGAILGDRTHMLEHSRDPDVFIRSMATRGSHGGLAAGAPEAVRLLDAAGFDWILLETVGVGQVEFHVADVVDTTLVVVNPGWGDQVQAAKAGLLEVADLFAVNKSDRPGAGETRRHLEEILDIRSDHNGGWNPPVVETTASEGRGIGELLDCVHRHRAWLELDGRLSTRRADRLWQETEAVFDVLASKRARALLTSSAVIASRQRLAARDLDPCSVAKQLVDDVFASERA